MSQALNKLLRSYSDAKATDDFESCIDAQFGINRKDANPLDIQKYTQVIQYLVSAGFKTDNDHGKDKLTIVPVRKYTSDNHVTYSTIHISLFEEHIIREYCESEDKIVSKYLKTPFMRIYKRTYVPVEAYMADNNMTVTYHQEQTFSRPDENAEVVSILSNWTNTRKKFKLTNCVTYTHPDHLFSVDLCLSRESKYGQNASGKFAPIPTLTMSESNLAKNMERVEIYIRFPTDIIYPEKQILEELRFGSRIILGGIQDTYYPIAFSERDQVITQYLHLFRPGEIIDEKRFGGLDISRIPFIGPYTEPITPENIAPVPHGTTIDVPNIRANFVVTDKTDGSRALLFIAPSRKIYMITPSMDVIYTGAQIRDVAFVNTLFDGEFVAYDKNKNPLQLFAVFDVYFVRGENVRSRAFMRPGYVIPEEDMVKDEYKLTPRYHLLEHLIQMRLQLVYAYGECKTPFTLKAKPFYYPIANPETTIFQQCANILNDESYEYERDGLIFTDMDMPVGVNVRTAPEDLFRHKARWAYSLKWKPSEQNSIDFLIRYKRTEDGRPVIQSEVDPVTGQFARYFVIHLYCSGNAKDNPMQSYLFPRSTNMGEVVPVLFRPSDPVSETAFEARILMEYVNNEWIIRTDAMELLEDDSIVEFYYDMQSPSQYRWKPMRMRYDKTYDYKVNKKRIYGNAFQTANKIWSSIHNPITTEMISTGSSLPSKSQDLTNVYYNRDGSKIYTKGLRQFHNYYIKQRLLKSVLHSSTTLIDYSCGRGGDLNKWVDLKVKFILGVDLSRDNIHNPWSGVYARMLSKMRQNIKVPPGFFLQGNSVDPIRTGDIAVSDSDKVRLLHLFGTGAPMSEDEVGPILSASYGIAKHGFHVGSSQFSIHYFFKDPKTIHSFLRNVAETISMDGHFIGTCYDGDTVFRKLKSEKPIRFSVDDQTIFRAERLYTATSLGKGAQSLGYPISVYQDSINQTIVEYLVQFSYLCELMNTYGFTLLSEMETTDKGMVGSGMFLEMFSDLYNHRFESNNETEFSDAIHMSADEKEISSWNRWFIFKKTRMTKESEWVDRYEADEVAFHEWDTVRGIKANNPNQEIEGKPEGPEGPEGQPSKNTEEEIVLERPDPVDYLEDEDIVQPDELFTIVEAVDRKYQTGESVTLFHAKARRPLSSLSTYMEIKGGEGVLIPHMEGVFQNKQGKRFVSAEHAFRSQLFTNEQTAARFSVDGDVGNPVTGFDMIGLKEKPKEEWMKRRGVGVVARTVVQTKTNQKKFGLVPDTEPVDMDKTWMHILKYVYTDEDLKKILLDTGDEYLLEKDESADSILGGHIEEGELKGQNKMGRYLMTIRAELKNPISNIKQKANAMAIKQNQKEKDNEKDKDTDREKAPVPMIPTLLSEKDKLPTRENEMIHVNSSFLRETFPEVEGVDRTQLVMTNQGRYSVSKTVASRFLVDLIRLRLPAKSDIRVTDATSSVGSDSIALGLHYQVNSIEMNPVQLKALSHNIATYGSNVNIQLYNGDSLQFIPRLTQDVVYIDAPWGGHSYKDQSVISLYLSGLELAEIYNTFHSHCTFMIFKVPPNYNIPDFQSSCKAKNVEIIPFYKPSDPTRVSFTFLVCSDISNPPTDLPLPLQNQPEDKAKRPSFTDLEEAMTFFRPYLEELGPRIKEDIEDNKDNGPHFAMTEESLRNTLHYFMNVVFQTGFIMVVTKDPEAVPVIYNIRTRTDRLDERVYVPFIKHHMEVLRNNRAVKSGAYNKIVQRLKRTPYRLLGNIFKDLKMNVNQESKDINEYEQFIAKYKVRLPPGLYYLNLNDTVALHPLREYPVPHVATVPTPPEGYYQWPMLPVFSASGRVLPNGMAYHDILIPTYDDIMDALTPPAPAPYVTNWESKTDNRAIFRGSGTGAGCSVQNNMRLKIASLGIQAEWKSYIDAHLTSSAGKLRIDDTGICQGVILPEWVGEPTSLVDQSKYKYIIHIDGNVAAYRLLKTMQTGSLILRVKSPFTQWSDQYLVSGRHYLEVAEDLSDLKQVIEYCRTHDAECAQIALDGKNVADRLRTVETMADHMVRAFS
jgi:predicted RNA methylase